MGALFHSIFSLFLLVSMSHLVVCSSIDTPLEWFDPCSAFTTFISVYASFWLKATYILSYSFNSHVHPPFWLFFMLWEVVGWVVSVVGSSLGLMLSLDASFVTRDCFFIDFFFEISSSHLSHFLFFH